VFASATGRRELDGGFTHYHALLSPRLRCARL